jgi:nucleoside-diphosphate-sugar epimerase
MTKVALILGSSGFIGRHLVNRLNKDGYYTIGVGTQLRQLCNSREYIVANLQDKCEVDTIFHKYNIYEVYLLAANSGSSIYLNNGSNDADIMSGSLEININIMNACVKFKIEKLFFASSACVYPSTVNIAHCIDTDA